MLCFLIGAALQKERQKLICLSSQHMHMHAALFGFKTIEVQENNGRIFYPPQSYSYYMEFDLEVLPFPKKDLWQLICWARDNINTREF